MFKIFQPENDFLTIPVHSTIANAILGEKYALWYLLQVKFTTNCQNTSTGAPGEPVFDLAASKKRAHDRGRSHERKYRHSSGEKQRYYSCDRYCSREHSHTKSATASCATSPSEGQKTSNMQVGEDRVASQQRVL